MSTFIEDIKNELNSTKTTTENGAVAYETSGSKLLDINFSVSSLRSATIEDIEKKFVAAYFENPVLAIKWMFFARDIRGGMGERRLFRICYSWLAKNKTDIAIKLIPAVEEYGRLDDLIDVAFNCNEIYDEVINFISKRMLSDITNESNDKSISLLAKWMPSINASSNITKARAKKLAKSLGMSEKEYRKTLSKLRKYLDVVEVKTSANKWDEVKYEAVPSKANIKYKNAFLKHDGARRAEFLKKLESGEAKINSSASFPCDIVHSYKDIYGWHSTIKEYDAALEGMWKNLPDYVKDVDNGNTIVVSDGSGSMLSKVGNSSMSALEVAQSLAIYFSEKMSTSPFKDKFITFSARPQLIDLSNAQSLHDKLEIISHYDECSNTNLEATMNLLLKTAIKNKTPQKDIPNVLILSDMNFDHMVDIGYNNTEKTLMENIEKKWNDAGYKLPRITYWNICGRYGRQAPIPVQQSESGISLVSGFSPAIASMVYSCKTNPYEVLIEKLSSTRYSLLDNIVKQD